MSVSRETRVLHRGVKLVEATVLNQPKKRSPGLEGLSNGRVRRTRRPATRPGAPAFTQLVQQRHRRERPRPGLGAGRLRRDGDPSPAATQVN
jgi:hypothetical protein